MEKIVNNDKALFVTILDSSIDIDKHTWFDMLGMCLLFARVSTLKRILVFRNNECVTMAIDEKADFTDLLRAFVDFDVSVYVDFNACLQFVSQVVNNFTCEIDLCIH